MQRLLSTRYSHLAYDLYGCPARLLLDVRRGLAAALGACREAHLSIVAQLSHVYPNNAYSITLFLAESHIAIHTWPERSYCALDIFLCHGDIAQAELSFLRFLRPKKEFRAALGRGMTGPIQIGNWATTSWQDGYFEAYETSEVLFRARSKYQLIEIVRSTRFGKILLLDNDIQLATADEHIYHEALVHPAMRAHSLPKSVLVIGGGDGGALREILKYQTVQRVVLVDIDELVVASCRQWIPEVNRGAFEDPRVNIRFLDAAKFRTAERFDVIILDLTATDGVAIPAYQRLTRRIASFLRKDGIIAMHSGWAPLLNGRDYSSAIFGEFRHVITTNQWVPSFACHWSFVIAWNHRASPHMILEQIHLNRPEIATAHFRTMNYTRNAFVRLSSSLSI